jgi:hypothetical protein
MSAAQDYIKRALEHATASTVQGELVKRQWAEATSYLKDDRPVSTTKSRFEPVQVTCGCGRRVAIECMFRCYFCGIWFCPKCAKEHFGEEADRL